MFGVRCGIGRFRPDRQPKVKPEGLAESNRLTEPQALLLATASSKRLNSLFNYNPKTNLSHLQKNLTFYHFRLNYHYDLNHKLINYNLSKYQ
jgi:hypothetical protein